MAATTSIFHPYLSPTLSSHLQSIPIDTLSRTPPSRLQTTALPNIGLIELVTASDFTALYDPLYKTSFPRRAERENSDLITARLAAQSAGTRTGLAPYRIVGIRDPEGQAIGAAQFSVLPLPTHPHSYDAHSVSTNNDTPSFAVPYLQYIYVRPSSRRQDMSEVLHTMVLAVASADALAMSAQPRTVPFTLFETEPPDHGDDATSRAYAKERSKIHTSTGGVAVVLHRESDGKILSAHVQPGLEHGDPPLTLVWVIRQSPDPDRPWDIKTIGRDLVAAYYQSLRDEGFPENNIRLAERIVEERCRGADFHLMPLADVKDFTDPEYLNIHSSN
ncbi:hypothetical protein LTR10_019898 [Elasticomyces elasticus]|uniref:Uncharacterized protein n=1 Tax=Exophiala sideris TaxID=1016849 RepID=A0ABR0IXY4_9EURO|nr:hypothetical protein LTR10_019898 [Elasticomyces elasticus]KAK5022378.1 hypothetical protein LTS07_010038 [Exophiala sideris]KAK5027264.1 hypothetical protein LTR13_009659 [Exophiala sideris]KAK5051232.1 hypothetical protein LTR69_010258 [Exophiala sideris]KAK5177804.1 hypothetical protein LTR44_009779 [Eurotiomycetes sp. CCFEE 6388]